jgi:DNA invertase Pin-like site-specific DNA recombinase
VTPSPPSASRRATSTAIPPAERKTTGQDLKRVSRRSDLVTHSWCGSSTGSRNLRHLVNVVHDLTERGIGLRVLTGQGAAIDTTTAAGKLVFGIFAALAEFERELISERTLAGLASARARGHNGGRKPKMTPAKLRLAAAAMGKKGTVVGDLCDELGITRATLYRHVSPTGELRRDGKKIVRRRAPAVWRS